MKLLNLKEEAIKLREEGYSYNIICDKLGLAKSTIANWIKEIPFISNKEVLKRIDSSRLRSAQYERNVRIAEIKEMRILAKKEIGKISKRDI